MTKQHHIRNVLIEIKPSKMLVGEIGLFSTRSLQKGTIIAETEKFDEIFHPWSDFKDLDKATRKKVKQYCVQSKEGFWTPEDFNWLPAPWNMNHSCSYNVGFDKDDNFVTSRSVKKGEELVWDYGMGIFDPRFRLQCKCKSKVCRKLVTGNDWKSEVFRSSNEKFFSRRLLKKVGHLDA